MKNLRTFLTLLLFIIFSPITFNTRSNVATKIPSKILVNKKFTQLSIKTILAEEEPKIITLAQAETEDIEEEDEKEEPEEEVEEEEKEEEKEEKPESIHRLDIKV